MREIDVSTLTLMLSEAHTYTHNTYRLRYSSPTTEASASLASIDSNLILKFNAFDKYTHKHTKMDDVRVQSLVFSLNQRILRPQNTHETFLQEFMLIKSL